ncbi:MAG: radical SAM protein [Magnetococcales bacterium]|nr:radical SAM protein [Magnetococcales bacterium]
MTTPLQGQIGRGKLSGYPERLEAWSRGEVSRPLAVEVAITHGCNHNCRHCGSQMFTSFDNRHFMEPAVFLRFLQEFRDLGGVECYFAGSGEPLLHPHFARFMQHGHELGLDMAFSSNGASLSPARAEAILPWAAWIRFSVNGGDAETYTRIHQCHADEYLRLRENFRNANALRKARGLGVRLALQCIVYDENWASLPSLMELAREMEADRVVLRNRINREGGLNPVPEEALALMKALEAAEPRLEVRWNSFSGADEACWSRCHGIHFRTNLDYQGNLFSCARNYYRESRFGNIHEASLHAIWHGDYRRELFAEVARGEDIPVCGKWCQVSFDNRYMEQYLRQRGAP